MYMYIFVCLSLSVYISVYLYLYVYLSVLYMDYIFLWLSVYLFVCLCVCLYACLPVCVSVFLSIRLSVFLAIYLSPHRFLHVQSCRDRLQRLRDDSSAWSSQTEGQSSRGSFRFPPKICRIPLYCLVEHETCPTCQAPAIHLRYLTGILVFASPAAASIPLWLPDADSDEAAPIPHHLI